MINLIIKIIIIIIFNKISFVENKNLKEIYNIQEDNNSNMSSHMNRIIISFRTNKEIIKIWETKAIIKDDFKKSSNSQK